MYRLYWNPDTGAFVVDVALTLAGVPFERVRIDTQKGEHRAPDFLALNPMAQVPVLVLPDGTVVTESAAMITFLADAHPGAGLAPAPGTSERAIWLRWLVMQAVDVYGAVLRKAYPQRFTVEPEGAPAVRAAALDNLRAWLGVLEQALDPGPFLLGSRRSAIDVYLLMLAAWSPMAGEFPRIQGLVARLREDPDVERLFTEYFSK